MKAINYLKRIGCMDAKINTNIEELAHLEALATKTTSVMGGERVQASSSQQKMADCVVKIVELKNIITKEIDEYIELKNEARHLLGECDSECMTLLYKRYFQHEDWEQIAVEMKFSYKWVSGGLHQRALAQMQKALDGKEKQDGKFDYI